MLLAFINEFWPVAIMVIGGMWYGYTQLDKYKEQQRKDIENNRESLVSQIKQEADLRIQQITELRERIVVLEQREQELIDRYNALLNVLAHRGILQEILEEVKDNGT